jgi:hypothetical protein
MEPNGCWCSNGGPGGQKIPNSLLLFTSLFVYWKSKKMKVKVLQWSENTSRSYRFKPQIVKKSWDLKTSQSTDSGAICAPPTPPAQDYEILCLRLQEILWRTNCGAFKIMSCLNSRLFSLNSSNLTTVTTCSTNEPSCDQTGDGKIKN